MISGRIELIRVNSVNAIRSKIWRRSLLKTSMFTTRPSTTSLTALGLMGQLIRHQVK